MIAAWTATISHIFWHSLSTLIYLIYNLYLRHLHMSLMTPGKSHLTKTSLPKQEEATTFASWGAVISGTEKLCCFYTIISWHGKTHAILFLQLNDVQVSTVCSSLVKLYMDFSQGLQDVSTWVSHQLLQLDSSKPKFLLSLSEQPLGQEKRSSCPGPEAWGSIPTAKPTSSFWDHIPGTQDPRIPCPGSLRPTSRAGHSEDRVARINSLQGMWVEFGWEVHTWPCKALTMWGKARSERKGGWAAGWGQRLGAGSHCLYVLA